MSARPAFSSPRLQARQARRMAFVIAAAVVGGLAAAEFARLCDAAMRVHARLYAAAPLASLVLLPVGFGLIAWITRRLAPEAAGSGIPQVVAAAEHRWRGRWGGQRVTLKTAAWKVVLTAALLVCGGSVGREGPTVQVVAGLMRSLTRGLRGGPGRRAIIIAGGAAGVSAAFNTPIAGVVFAVEELARGFERRTIGIVLLVVVTAGFTAYALQGDYAYFGVLKGDPALWPSWIAAPLIGAVGGLGGGLFSRALIAVTGPGANRLNLWRRRHAVLFAVICGAAAAVIALVSHGATFGAGYAEAEAMLTTGQQGGWGGGLGFALAKALASLAASCSGAPGGVFAPSLATGAGIGAAFVHLGLLNSGRNAVVLGMAAYLTGVVQAPLTSAIILMEMTREPSLVGPLMLSCLVARWVSGWVCPEPLYHALSRNWLPPKSAPPAPDAEPAAPLQRTPGA